MSDSLSAFLDDDSIVRMVGPEVFRRGRAYARSGRVVGVNINEESLVIMGTVQGNRGAPYSTVVRLPSANGERGFGRTLNHATCSCPMGNDCKHAAALMVAARASDTVKERPVGASWERRLGQMLTAPPDAQRGIGTEPLGLLFEVRRPKTSRDRSGPAELHVRPVMRGRSGKWVRSGAGWDDLNYSRVFLPEHRDLLLQLHSMALSRESYYYRREPWAPLSRIGPMLWPFLDAADQVGLSLRWGTGDEDTVEIAPGSAEITLDLRRSDSAEGHVLGPAVTVDGNTRDPRSVGWLGTVAHGLFYEHDSDPNDRRRLAGLTLARLDRAPSPEFRQWLAQPDELAVPQRDLDRLMSDFYPQLRRTAKVISSDHSVEFPEIKPPVITLHVSPQPKNRLQLTWGVEYDVGENKRRFGLEHGRPDVRDPDAENQLLADLPLPYAKLPQLQGQHARRPAPSALLSGLDAALFANETIPLLRGHGILVEVSGEMPDYRLVETAPLVELSATEPFDGSDWFDLGVEVSIDGEPVPFVDLFGALARDDGFLILESGAYFPLDRPEFETLRSLIAEARELQEREGDGLRLSKYQASLWEDLLELGVVNEQSERWARTVKGLLNLESVEPVSVPDALKADLRPYQIEGYQWLAFLWDHGLGGILADDMGLGKTLQALALVCRARSERSPDDAASGPFLVVAPSSVVSNWASEAARFAPHLTVVAIEETEAKRGTTTAELVAGADVVITSYTLLRMDYDAYASVIWSGMVLDEAQFVKNYRAKTYQCVRRLPVPFKLAVTGTPLENSLMDLWALLSIVAPGLFPRPDKFADFYRKPIERGENPELLTQLKRRIRPLMLRRTKEIVAADLPPKQEQVIEVVLNPRHQKIYQTHLQRERQKVLGMIDDLDKNRFTILRSLTLLRQLALDASLIDDAFQNVSSSKIDTLYEQLDEVVQEGHRALVFSQFTGFLSKIRDKLDAAGVEYCYLDGKTRNRAKVIERFKDGAAPVFLISLKAGGFGLNLAEADYCFVMDPWWNPASEAQAVDRAHRIGQQNTVMVYRLIAKDTIEEKVMELKKRKEKLFDSVLGDGALQSAALSAVEIRALLGA